MKFISVLSALFVALTLYVLVFERDALKSFATTGDFGSLVSAISSPEFTLTPPPNAEQSEPEDTTDVTLAAMSSGNGAAGTTDPEAQSGLPMRAGTDSAVQSELAPPKNAGKTGGNKSR